MAERSLFAELRERKVVQAAAIYVPVAWGITEIVVTIVEQLFLPQWVSTLAVIFFVVGFPIAMFLAWTFDVTRDGIQRTVVSSRRGTASIVVSMAMLIAGTAGLFFLIKPALENRPSPEPQGPILSNSLAVLPFDFSGPDPDDAYLGPGLSDELRDQLGRVEGLRIAAPSSSVAVVRDGVDAKDIAKRLGVRHLLEGNVRRQGNLLRVSVYLVDGSSGLSVWQDTFDRGRRELLNVQQDIAQAVAQQLFPDDTPEIAVPITDDAIAHDKIILARHYETQVRERENVDQDLLGRAVQLYREATELDPRSPLAHSRLAGALMVLDDIEGAEAEAFKALAIDPSLAEVQHTLGKLLWVLGRANVGEPLQRAVEINPNLPDALHDFAFWRWFNFGEEGVEDLYRRALELDPLSASRYGDLGQYLAVNDDYDGAREVIRQLQARIDSPAAYRAIAKIYDLIGDTDHAIAWTIKARNAEPANPDHVRKLAEYYVDIGDVDTARKLSPELGVGLLFKLRHFDEMIDEAELLIFDFPDDRKLQILLAAAYSFTGRYEQAVRMVNSTGVMETINNVNRGPQDYEAIMILVDAAYGSGEIDEARDLVAWRQETLYHGEQAYWWVSVSRACESAVLGDDEDARRFLRRALQGQQLVWDPFLLDVSCFRRFKDDPTYKALVAHFDKQRKLLRARLPQTLRGYGVSL